MSENVHRRGGTPSPRRRLLVIANGAAASERLRGAVGSHVAGSPEGRVLVVAPAASAIRRPGSDSEGARRAAVRRLQACIALLSEDGIDAEGMIGDANPVRAIEDALRIFPADGLLVAMLPQERSASRAADVAERARARFELPTMQLVVDAA